MVHVVVEAQASGLAIVVLDRDQQLEFQVLLALAVRDDLAAAPEERVVREVDRVGQAQRLDHPRAAFDPGLAERHDLLGRADPHVLAHPEQLHAGRVERRLVAEAVREDVDDPAVGRQLTRACDDRVDRVARGGRHHDVGRLLAFRPVVAAIEALQYALVLVFVAAERMHAARELREALHVFAALELGAAHRRREAQHFGLLVGADARDERVERFHDALEPFAAAEQTLDAGRDQQARVDQFVAQRVDARAVDRCIGGSGGGGGHGKAIVHVCFSSVAGRSASSRFEVLTAMRSLLIISGAACRSRMWRPMLNGVPCL